jgi:ribosomal-protein-alanine N-acetyltransferase
VGIPTIETNRLLLAPFTPGDAGDLHVQIYGSEAVMEYLPGGAPRSLERVQDIIEYFADHWAKYSFGVWAVREKASGALIGQCGLNTLEGPPQVEVVVALGADHWGQGFATEAAHAALRYGFQTLRMARIVGLVDPGNPASERVLDKLGMTFQKQTKYYAMKLKMYAIDREAFASGSGVYLLYRES